MQGRGCSGSTVGTRNEILLGDCGEDIPFGVTFYLSGLYDFLLRIFMCGRQLVSSRQVLVAQASSICSSQHKTSPTHTLHEVQRQGERRQRAVDCAVAGPPNAQFQGLGVMHSVQTMSQCADVRNLAATKLGASEVGVLLLPVGQMWERTAQKDKRLESFLAPPSY
jgi:hypothetical protein